MNKNIRLLVLLLVLQPVLTRAQTSKIDSLKQALLKEKQDTSRTLLVSELSRTYVYSKPDTALLLAQQGLNLARQINFTKGEAYGLNLTAKIFNMIGNYSKGFGTYPGRIKKV